MNTNTDTLTLTHAQHITHTTHTYTLQIDKFLAGLSILWGKSVGSLEALRRYGLMRSHPSPCRWLRLRGLRALLVSFSHMSASVTSSVFFCLFIYLSVLSVCLSCLSYLSVCLVYLFVCLSVLSVCLVSLSVLSFSLFCLVFQSVLSCLFLSCLSVYVITYQQAPSLSFSFTACLRQIAHLFRLFPEIPSGELLCEVLLFDSPRRLPSACDTWYTKGDKG